MSVCSDMDDNMVPESTQKAILRHLEGTSQPEDDALILSFIEKSEENKRIFFDFKAIWTADKVLASDSLQTDFEQMLSRLNARIDAEQETETRRTRRNWTRILGMAASLAALLALAIGLIHYKSQTSGDRTVYVTHVNQSGDTESLVMPDGTRVWLVAGSKIDYAIAEDYPERKVILSGEGFFNVAKDTIRPFTIHAEKFSVVALGTSFNVRAMPSSEYSEVLLNEGSVVLKNAEGNSLVRLKPNQKATVRNTDNDIEITDMYASSFITGKYNLILLDDMDEEQIRKHLEARFGVTIRVEGNPSHRKYNISYRKTNTLEEVLEMLDFMTEKKWTADY